MTSLTQAELADVVESYKNIAQTMERALNERTAQLVQMEKHAMRQSEIINNLRTEIEGLKQMDTFFNHE